MLKNRVRKESKKLWVKIPLLGIAICLFIIGSYAIFVYNNTKNTVNEKMFDPVETIDTDITRKKLQETEQINILLLGIDTYENKKGRSDAIMVMQLEPQTDAMKIVSIPRDTRVEIVGKGFEDKINHAYAFGEAEMAIATVEKFLNIKLDYYVSINMNGLIELVNELDTIKVQNELAWSNGEYDFPKGTIELDGDKAVAFVRMRKEDPSGDFGRTTRQRKVIEGIIQRGATVGSVPKFTGMVDVLGKNMSTNMDFVDMKKLFSRYRDTRKNITEYMLDGNGQKMDGIYYLIVEEEEVQKVHHMLTEEE